MLIPESHLDLLERPLFGHLAQLRPDGRLQSNPVWYLWDGDRLRLTTTSDRQKGRNAVADARVALSVHDPDQPYRYLEVRGEVVATEPDPEGEFFDVLAKRYNLAYDELPDAPRRIVLVLAPAAASWQ
ncbi:PPOX class F420-dependent oxidoreductase [Frankia sp. AgPm24]|uniref:PPOX class F420-dependent oxidoreductase n=1 Tax=Frankia umida TaxID=573489 RepID=A0ABT0K0S3_9ACTN|nr:MULTISPECIES: PPOX class F420-dependent oxidoreductase [Frankia]MCK9877397.1 PPOX class F420-dependent oxidoreductase [Frankia umida]MCK9923856.1 PPOX class F420-dependent oxidoreductase [Frankia sp. AgPm24]